MKTRLLGLFLVLVLIVTFMAGCGGSSQKSADMPMAQKPSADSNSRDDGGYGGEPAPAEAPRDFEADSLAGGGSSTVNMSNIILAERKIIRSANLTIEVENFDNAFANIEGIIANIGFIQQTNINTQRVYVEEELKLVKNGTIVLRVDKEMFDSVINKLRGLGDVYNYTTDGQDVTDQVFDVESRLRLLRMQQEKLEAYVAKLNDIEEIFKAESKLTEIRYQIESLTGNLNKLNSLVELSTITLNLNEKRPGYDPKPETYGEKLLNSLKESLLNVVEFLGDLLLFIISALPILVFIGLCVLFGMWIYKKTIKKHRNNNAFMKGPAYPGGPAAYPPSTQPVQPAPPMQGATLAPQGAAQVPQSAAKAPQGAAPAPEMAKQTEEPDGKQQ
jgi:hypothetical protein